jgi:hypothetical protein
MHLMPKPYALVPVPQLPITYTLVNLNSVLDNDPFDSQAICIGTCVPQPPITLVNLNSVLDNDPFDVQAGRADLSRPLPQLPCHLRRVHSHQHRPLEDRHSRTPGAVSSQLNIIFGFTNILS